MPASLRRVWDFSAGGIRASLEESLERLGVPAVDVLYLHDPDEHDLARRPGRPASPRWPRCATRGS